MQYKKWKPGDPITINRIVWDEAEEAALRDVLEHDWFGPARYAKHFEEQLARYVGVAKAQLTNSGSSALFLSAQAMMVSGQWSPGDYIIHPACTFPTSCNPILLLGMIPVFVDVEPGTYNADPLAIECAIETYPFIAGAIIPHLLGNTTDIDRLLKALNGRPLIEDCCDTLGTTWRGEQVGSFGRTGCFSFYGSHHITAAGVGGAVVTDDPTLYRRLHSMTFWGREMMESTDPVTQFLHRYTYEEIGHDMQMSELQAAFAFTQMLRIDEINAGRRARFAEMFGFFRDFEDWFVLPRSYPKCVPSWFGFPVEVRLAAPFSRLDFVRYLLEKKVEIRPLFAGNIIRQPAYVRSKYVVVGDLTQSDINLDYSLFLPSWGHMPDEMVEQLLEIYTNFLGRY